MKVFITGCSGFIGYHVSKKYLDLGFEVFGIDNMNDYYDILLKEHRLNFLKKYDLFSYQETNLKDLESSIDKDYNPDLIIHLAAQAGVRLSFDKPEIYQENNIDGFFKILEFCRNRNKCHLLFASSSSVYGDDQTLFKESNSLNPLSFYGETKKINEIQASHYSKAYGIKISALRFFTVYGPMGRPDMAYYKFCSNIIENKEIEVYGNGDLKRDFTYIDDVVDAILSISKRFEKIYKDLSSKEIFRIYNVGGSAERSVNDLISIIEKKLSLCSKKVFLDKQHGEMECTKACNDRIRKEFDWSPKYNLESGINVFIDWLSNYKKL